MQKQLDEKWTVFHSYPWLRRNSGRLQEGETDFILLHPKGLLVLEVKGGRISYNPDTREWRQNHHGMKDPFVQASQGMHNVVAQMGGTDFVRGYAAAFPDCRFVGSLPPGVVRNALLDADDLMALDNRLHALLAEWGAGRTPASRAEYERLRKALLPHCQLIPDLRHGVRDEERVLHTLTELQLDTLNGLFTMDRLLVKGVAGSGKTLLAIRRAMDLAQQGIRTLFLCYNKNLAQALVGSPTTSTTGSLPSGACDLHASELGCSKRQLRAILRVLRQFCLSAIRGKFGRSISVLYRFCSGS